MNDDESSSIDLEIDELVLNGFAAADGHAIGEAFQRELTRLLVEQGVSPELTRNVELEHLNADVNQVTQGSNSETIAVQSAQAIYRRFSK
jgi:hypothetical protein